MKSSKVKQNRFKLKAIIALILLLLIAMISITGCTAASGDIDAAFEQFGAQVDKAQLRQKLINDSTTFPSISYDERFRSVMNHLNTVSEQIPLAEDKIQQLTEEYIDSDIKAQEFIDGLWDIYRELLEVKKSTAATETNG
jgi:hypothetical protein